MADFPDRIPRHQIQIENNFTVKDGGKVIVHQLRERQPQPRPCVQESLGQGIPIRWTPSKEDDLKNAARRDGKNFNLFIRDLSEIGIHFTSEEVAQIIEDRALIRLVLHNRNAFIQFINALRQE